MKIINAQKKLVDESTETVEEVKVAKITLAENENSYKCSSYTMYTVLLWICFTINVGGIGAYFVYFCEYLKKDVYSWSNKLLNT